MIEAAEQHEQDVNNLCKRGKTQLNGSNYAISIFHILSRNVFLL